MPDPLRAARKARGLSQGELAYLSGVSERTIRTMERAGGYDVGIDSLLAVVGVLGVPVGSVMRHPHRDGPWSLAK